MKKHLLLIVILFSSIACKRSIEIDNTVISLKDFRSIGELITAEYYGEVVAGLSQIYKDSISSALEEDFSALKDKIINTNQTLDFVYQNDKAKQEVKIAAIKDKLSADRAITNTEHKELQKAERKLRRIERRKERKLLKNLRKSGNIDEKESFKELVKATNQNKRELLHAIQDQPLTEILASKEFSEYQKKQIPKKQRKQELVYLGRGAVKAGYDLAKISNDNIFFSNNSDTIYIVDVDPELLNVDINPWFYFPSNQLKDDVSKVATKADSSLFGFQVLMGEKTKNITLNDISRVKSECKNLLRKEALDRNIYEKAKENAENALEGLFGLMTLAANQTVQKVIISHSKYFYDKADFLYDLRIDSAEFNDIRLLVMDDLIELDSAYYGFQSLAYQQNLVDQFVISIYTQSLGKRNYSKWEAWSTEYFESRAIDISSHLNF